MTSAPPSDTIEFAKALARAHVARDFAAARQSDTGTAGKKADNAHADLRTI